MTHADFFAHDAQSTVSRITGFPSPAELWRERVLRLDDLLVLHPATTYFVRALNWQWGPNTLFYLAQGTRKPWAMRQMRRSPRYTTRWGEILTLAER